MQTSVEQTISVAFIPVRHLLLFAQLSLRGRYAFSSLLCLKMMGLHPAQKVIV